MWTREERHFRTYPKKMDPGEITDYRGQTLKGFTPHILTIIWYSTYQGWELSEVTLSGHVTYATIDHIPVAQQLPGTPVIQSEGRLVKLVSGGAKRPLLMADWINERIEATRPEGTSKFVNHDELGWEAKDGWVAESEHAKEPDYTPSEAEKEWTAGESLRSQ